MASNGVWDNINDRDILNAIQKGIRIIVEQYLKNS